MRIIQLTDRYTRAVQRRGILAGSPDGRAVGATLRALAAEPELPAAADYETLLPPVARAFVRRVQSRNLWVLYVFDDARVLPVSLTVTPPIPVED